MKTLRDFFIGTFLGFILGGLLGLLLTPHSGVENRRLINQKYTQTANKVQEAMRERQEELQEELNSFSG